MSFVALLPVRDEADIVGQCLRQALTWADAIYVFDTGSVDETWEIVMDCAARDKRIKPLRKQPVYFSETRLRAFMFDQARRAMKDGDWFLRMDADEFHHIAPPLFVKERLKPAETIAYYQYYDFRLTQSEVDAWNRGDETLADRERPIEDRRRYFTPWKYSEPRLCRYRETMQWPETVSFPFNAGFVARARLPIRHYPHRDPPQLERRCRLRAIMMSDADNSKHWSRPELHHWAEREWHKFIVPDNQPDLVHWDARAELQQYAFTNHLKPAHVRLVQRLIHSAFLPLLDGTRSRFPGETALQTIPLTVQEQLETELGSAPGVNGLPVPNCG